MLLVAPREAAWAGVHCGDQLKARRVSMLMLSPRYADFSTLQRLPKLIQNRPRKLGQLVKK
jgi:hypothetical protein